MPYQWWRITEFDQAYINKHERQLDTRDLFCYSCYDSKSPTSIAKARFVLGELIHSKRINNGHGSNYQKRHLLCAIVKGLITEKEARKEVVTRGLPMEKFKLVLKELKAIEQRQLG